jgi:hypothetical protein
MKRFILLLAAGCGTTEQAESVELPVTTVGAPIAAATTDLGYDVQVTSLRVAVTNIQFTIEGEQHEGALVAPHPGHSAGGEVTGELAGNFVLTWNGQAQPMLGLGTLLVGDYRGANFAIRAADAGDVPAGDPLLGHAFHLTGTITKAGTTRPFDATLDVEPDTQVIGLPFEDTITKTSSETLAFGFVALDPNEQDTAFDGVDFFADSATGAIEIRPGSVPHNIIRRAIQTHDHYGVFPQ